jgi:hypothetical protein
VEVQRARGLAMDLIETVRQAYESHVSGVPPQSAGHYQSQPQPPQPQQFGPPGMAAPPGADAGFSYGAPAGMTAPGMTAPGSDPYAAYGGYQAYQQYCTPLIPGTVLTWQTPLSMHSSLLRLVRHHHLHLHPERHQEMGILNLQM